MLFSHPEILGSAPLYCVEFFGVGPSPSTSVFPWQHFTKVHTHLSRSVGTAGQFGAAVTALSHPIPQKKSNSSRFLDNRHTTQGKNPLDE